MRARETRLFFLHVPKTAGTTLGKVLRAQFSSKNTFVYWPNKADEILKCTEDEKNNTQLVIGHFSFGFHEHFKGDHSYFTVLREPLSRLISSYHYLLRKTDHRFHETVKDIDILDFSQHSPNVQVRMISGKDEEFMKSNPQETLAIAKQNLEKHFSVVGLQERLDETLILARQVYGWKKMLYYDTLNVAPSRFKDSLSEEKIQLLKQHLSLDIELYDYAKRKFEHQLKDVPNLKRKLTLLRRRNSIYSALKALYKKHIKQ